MYGVSSEYKEQIRNMLRNPSYIKVNFSFIDPQAKVEAVLSDNGHTFLSDVENVKNAITSNINYATLEYDRFVLDGKQTLLPDSNYEYQGYVSDIISDADGVYSNKPTLTINFGTTNFTFLGLGFTFDKYVSEYPKQLRLKAYLDGNLVYDKTQVTNKSDEYYWEDAIPLCNKIEVIGVQSTNKYRRFRIRDIIFGINKVFDSTVITDATWKRDVDLISSKLPNITFDFTILDIERQYDSENPEGLFVYLEEQQPCSFSLGYELDDGSIEWQQAGYTLSKGEVEIKGDAVIPTVKFNTVSTLSYLTKKYKKGVYGNGRVLTNIIKNADFSNGTTDWLEVLTVNNGVATFTPRFQYDNLRQLQSSVVVGRKYYFRTLVKTTSSTVSLLWGDYVTTSFTDSFHTGSNNFEKLSTVLEIPSNATIPNWFFGIRENGAVLREISVDDFMVCDLTSTFGVGNEPTKEWCDANIKFFNSSITIGNSLYDYSIELLEYANLPKDNNGDNMWNIDTSLKSLYTTTPLPKLEIRELLQLIANASMCTLDVDRNGYITIKPQSTTQHDYTIGLVDITSLPILKKYPTLQGIDTYLNSITIASTVSELGKFDISSANNTTYEFEYNMATEISAIVGTGLTIVGTPQYYAESCVITLNGSGTLTINGKLLTISKRNISVEFNSTGDRCSIGNILITSEQHAINYATWIGNYLNRRNEYTLTDRGFPEIDCGDNIKIETLFTNTTENVDVTVVSSEINYNGSIKGKTKVLIQ